MDIFATVEKNHSMKLGIIGREEQEASPTELHARPSFPAQGQDSGHQPGGQDREEGKMGDMPGHTCHRPRKPHQAGKTPTLT